MSEEELQKVFDAMADITTVQWERAIYAPPFLTNIPASIPRTITDAVSESDEPTIVEGPT